MTSKGGTGHLGLCVLTLGASSGHVCHLHGAPGSWEGCSCSAGPQGRDCQQTGSLLPPPPLGPAVSRHLEHVWGPGDAVCGPHRGLWSPPGLERTL